MKRTPKVEQQYQDYLSNKPKDYDPFIQDAEQEKIKEYTYWTVYRNKFPYDVEDHLLVVITNQHAKVGGVINKISDIGWWEYKELEDIHTEYPEHHLQLNPPKRQSVKSRLHFHLIKE